MPNEQHDAAYWRGKLEVSEAQNNVLRSKVTSLEATVASLKQQLEASYGATKSAIELLTKSLPRPEDTMTVEERKEQQRRGRSGGCPRYDRCGCPIPGVDVCSRCSVIQHNNSGIPACDKIIVKANDLNTRWRELSNIYRCDMVSETKGVRYGCKWDTVYQLYEATKFHAAGAAAEVIDLIYLAADHHQVSQIVEQYAYLLVDDPDTDDDNPQAAAAASSSLSSFNPERVMLDILRIKFRNDHCKRVLGESTEDKNIEYHDPLDQFWGGGKDTNRMGKLLMQLRKEIKS